MKKLLTFAAALFVCGSALLAQRGFHTGITGSVGISGLAPQNSYAILQNFSNALIATSELNYRTTVGGTVGLAIGHNFSTGRRSSVHIGPVLELQYAFLRQRYEDDLCGPAYLGNDTLGYGCTADGRVNVKRDVKLDYFQIPLLLKIVAGTPGKRAKFAFAIGPQFGFRTRAEENNKLNDIPYEPTYADSTTVYAESDKFNKVDVGIALRIGVDVFITDSWFFDIGIHGYYGLTDLNGKAIDKEWYSQNDVEYKSSHSYQAGVYVGLHYLFGRGSY